MSDPKTDLKVTLTLGFIETAAFATSRVDGTLTPKQARIARLILDHLRQQQACLASGRLVEGNMELFRYLLEQAGDAMERGGFRVIVHPAPPASPRAPRRTS